MWKIADCLEVLASDVIIYLKFSRFLKLFPLNFFRKFLNFFLLKFKKAMRKPQICKQSPYEKFAQQRRLQRMRINLKFLIQSCSTFFLIVEHQSASKINFPTHGITHLHVERLWKVYRYTYISGKRFARKFSLSRIFYYFLHCVQGKHVLNSILLSFQQFCWEIFLLSSFIL